MVWRKIWYIVVSIKEELDMKKEKDTSSIKRKVITYVVIGVITFTMIFSVFATLVAAM